MLSENDEQTPIKQSFCGSLKRDAHWKCMILTILIYGCLVAIIWCRMAIITTVTVSYYGQRMADTHVTKSKPCEDGYIYIPIAFVIMLYLVYLVECWHCHTRLELKHKVDVHSVYNKITQMQNAVPIVWWKALCYHYVRKTRHVTRYRNGDSFTSTQVYYERVNSHTAGSAFNFSQCGIKDVSATLSGVEDFPATKIRFTKGYSFACGDAEYEFDEQRNTFYRDNERRDDYIETREGMDLLNVNFKQYMIAFSDPDNLPWYVSHIVFWVASFLLLSWPLRVIIEYKTAYVHYHVHKVFGTNYLEPNPVSAPLTRVSTMGSSDLEVIIQNNYIAPSYSEAVLMASGRAIEIPDANGNVSATKYGATRSMTFTALSAIESDKEAIRGVRSGNALNFSRCNSFSILNGGVVLQNSNMQLDRNNGDSRRKHRRMFVFSRQNGINLSPNSPTEPLIFINPSCHSARMIRSEHSAQQPEISDPSRLCDSSINSALSSIQLPAIRHGRAECSNVIISDFPRTNDPPPNYQEALRMKRPINEKSTEHSPVARTRIVVRENENLNPSSNRKTYHTVMETSL